MKSFGFALMFILLIVGNRPIFSQVKQSPKIEVIFDCECDDMVGTIYATEIRDILSVSPRYKLSPKSRGTKSDFEGYTLKVTTVSADKDNMSIALSYAVLYSRVDFFLGNSVQVCGKSVIKECAATTIASMDQIIAKWSEPKK